MLIALVHRLFWHFYGSGCSWSLPVRWVLKLEILSFSSKSLSFFWANRMLICCKSAENKMSFEIHVTTIATGLLSFGLKNRWVFWAVEFYRAWLFSKMLKKAWHSFNSPLVDWKSSRVARVVLDARWCTMMQCKLSNRQFITILFLIFNFIMCLSGGIDLVHTQLRGRGGQAIASACMHTESINQPLTYKSAKIVN